MKIGRCSFCWIQPQVTGSLERRSRSHGVELVGGYGGVGQIWNPCKKKSKTGNKEKVNKKTDRSKNMPTKAQSQKVDGKHVGTRCCVCSTRQSEERVSRTPSMAARSRVRHWLRFLWFQWCWGSYTSGLIFSSTQRPRYP